MPSVDPFLTSDISKWFLAQVRTIPSFDFCSLYRAFECRNQRRPPRSKFRPRVHAQLSQYVFTFRCQRKQHLSPVCVSSTAADISSRRQSVHQLHCTVVLNEQTLRQFSDTRAHIFGESLQSQHQLMLARLEPRVPYG